MQSIHATLRKIDYKLYRKLQLTTNILEIKRVDTAHDEVVTVAHALKLRLKEDCRHEINSRTYQ